MKAQDTLTVDPQLNLSLYRAMFTARCIDQREEDAIRRGAAFFHVSCACHEANAALQFHLTPEDWLHCHYRDKALLIARGVAPIEFFRSLYCKATSHSRGRQMNAHMSAREHNVMSIVGPVGNQALQAVGVAAALHDQGNPGLVLCALGDGTTQQGEVLEAIAEAVRDSLPVLFLIEDNGYAISTRTALKTFYSLPSLGGESVPDQFYGIPIQHLDGRNALKCLDAFEEVVRHMRETRLPAIVVMDVERLSSHTNADDQTVYRSALEISKGRVESDPVEILRNQLLADLLDNSELLRIEREILAGVREADEQAWLEAEPALIKTAKAELEPTPENSALEYLGSDAQPRLTMLEAIGDTLRSHLENDERVVLFGEDLEDPKGDVFGITRGLSTSFPERVLNSALSESTIVGTAIGRALAGQRPVAFLQFADFLPLAFNQIASELGSMQWRTDGAWTCPVILMIACGGYRPGLGPFHAQTMESIAAHTPGLDIAMPSTAADAVGMLNASFASARPTLFFYPKNCLNNRDTATSNDVARQYVPLGKSRTMRRGDDITLVAYGNTVSMCLEAARDLEKAGIEAEVIDLRWIVPWDESTVLASANKTKRMVVVHEDNITCGIGAEIVAAVQERATERIAVRRVARPDVHVPCNYLNQLQILPGPREILDACAELLDLVIERQDAQRTGGNALDYVINAMGSSPADETVTVLTWMVKVGQHIERDEVIALLEADKANLELASPESGTVERLFVAKDSSTAVGSPLVSLRLDKAGAGLRLADFKRIAGGGTPEIKRRKPAQTPHSQPAVAAQMQTRGGLVGIAGVSSVTGGRVVNNEVVLKNFPGVESEDIVKRTGIESRNWLAEGESVLSLAQEAVRRLIASAGTLCQEVKLLVCSTGTPAHVTPSLACSIMAGLPGDALAANATAYDINAACSGYIFALANAFDFLTANPSAAAIVVTSEALSPLLDAHDFNTAIVFGDAATATLVVGESHIGHARARFGRPITGSTPQPAGAICVPTASSNRSISMLGKTVFADAVKTMGRVLQEICNEKQLKLDDLDLVVPHQANDRIAKAIGARLGLTASKVFSNIKHLGNTSSSTIPLALESILPAAAPNAKIALCAFGGGYTFGGCLLTVT